MTPEFVHTLFSLAAYSVGFAVFRHQRRRGDFLAGPTRWTLVTAAVLGAAAGAKVLHWLANPSLWSRYAEEPITLLAGNTLVGGLLGGWIAVEVVKSRLSIEERTGDLYVAPLLVGIVIGRLGCFFAGLADRTYGVVTSLPWGVDFGDGLSRHPTQLYEIAFLLALAPWLLRRPPSAAGWRFRTFILAYLAFRFAVDGLKPYDRIVGLNPIQWACFLALVHQARELPSTWRWLRGLDAPEVR